MKKTLLTMTTFAVVGIGSLFMSDPINAETTGSLKEKQSEVKDERSEVKKDLSKAETEVADILIDLKELNDEIDSLEETLKANEKAMEKAEKAIESTEDEIKIFEKEIEELEEIIQKRHDILKERALSIQKNGGDISYLEVIFGSQSFGQFISRISAMNKISDSDVDLLEQQKADKDKVEKQRNKLEEKLVDLNDQKEELKGMTKFILEQKEATEQKREELKLREKELKEVKSKLEIEDDKLASLESKINKNISNINNPPVATTSAKSAPSSGGKLGWPTAGGYISSPMGQRWGRMHKGIDIARTDRSTSPPIYAAESGVVESAGFDGSYGNKVVIAHSNGLKTIYAHLSSLSVGAGQSVSKGSKLGVMGRTGRVTGVHLHFEVYKNGSLQNPTSYLGG